MYSAEKKKGLNINKAQSPMKKIGFDFQFRSSAELAKQFQIKKEKIAYDKECRAVKEQATVTHKRKHLMPTISNAREGQMLKNGFMPGKGLGASLQGIVQPVSLLKNLDTFGLEFKPTAADIRRARKLKQRAWALPKPIPRLSRSFVKPSTTKFQVSKILGPLIDANGDLDKD